jgi:probable HAF family extracellular repeat protein
MLRKRVCTILCATALSLGTTVSAQTYISFDVPGSTYTSGLGINADGAVVGRFVDSAGNSHGYMLKEGKFTTIDYPGAVFTNVWGINSLGDIVGVHYEDPTKIANSVGAHGFLLRQGVFTPLDYPGKFGLIPSRINDAGQVVGCNHDDGPSTGLLMGMHGFLFSNNNWSQLNMDMTMHNGLTADGSVIAGLIGNDAGTYRGYLASNGVVVPFDFPFSTSTQPWDISPSGDTVVGFYTDTANKTHGFLLLLGGLGESIATFGLNPQLALTGPFAFVSIDYPGATSTFAYGINSRGDVVGRYVDSAGNTHGFFHSPGLLRTRAAQQ